jgi:tetratricopeptide (TPR) repeat protein
LDNLSWALCAQGQYQEAQRAAEESLRIREEIGDWRNSGLALVRLGEVSTALGDYELAGQYFQRSFVIGKEIDDLPIKRETLDGQAALALAMNQPQEAVRLAEAELSVARAHGGAGPLASAFVQLGHAALELGQDEQAKAYFRASLEPAMQGKRYALPSALVGFAALRTREGDPDGAAELIGLVLHHRVTHQRDRDWAQTVLLELEPELAPEGLATALARGQARQLEEVAQEILEEQGPR